MATPFSITAALNLPGDVGLPADALPVSFSSSFSSKADAVLNITEAGTTSVSFGTVGSPGAKAFFVKMDPSSSAAPVLVKVNESESGGLEVSPGGFILYGNPSPVDGVTSLDIVATTPGVVRIWVLG